MSINEIIERHGIRFPRFEPFEIAVYECRIYDSQGRRIQVIPAKRIQEVLAEVYTEPTYRERVQSKKRTPPLEYPKPQHPTTPYPAKNLLNLSRGTSLCRGRLIGIIPAKRIGQVLAEPYIEPTAFEHYKKNWKLAGSC